MNFRIGLFGSSQVQQVQETKKATETHASIQAQVQETKKATETHASIQTQVQETKKATETHASIQPWLEQMLKNINDRNQYLQLQEVPSNQPFKLTPCDESFKSCFVKTLNQMQDFPSTMQTIGATHFVTFTSAIEKKFEAQQTQQKEKASKPPATSKTGLLKAISRSPEVTRDSIFVKDIQSLNELKKLFCEWPTIRRADSVAHEISFLTHVEQLSKSNNKTIQALVIFLQGMHMSVLRDSRKRLTDFISTYPGCNPLPKTTGGLIITSSQQTSPTDSSAAYKTVLKTFSEKLDAALCLAPVSPSEQSKFAQTKGLR